MAGDDFDSTLVYSTSGGVPGARAAGARRPSAPDTGGKICIKYETKGRKGKGMTLISGLCLDEAGLLDLAKRFKRMFGTGGSVKDYVIELQGDFREQAAKELFKLGLSR